MILCAALLIISIWIWIGFAFRHSFTMMSYYIAALPKRHPDCHSTNTPFNGQNGMHIKVSHWVECQEWQMWFEISSPALITVSAFSCECHFIPKVCLRLVWLDQSNWFCTVFVFFSVMLHTLAQSVNVMSVQLPWEQSHSISKYIPPWAAESVQSASSSIMADNCITAARTA